MKVKGDEFLKNLEIEKEKAALEQRKNELNSKKKQSVYQSNTTLNDTDNNTNYQELDDIRLNKNNNNKQKYILFGFALVLLFLITIITIRFISEPTQNNAFLDNDIIEDTQDEIIEKKSEPVINSASKQINKSLDINKIVQSEEKIDIIHTNNEKTKEQELEQEDGDLFGIEEEAQTDITDEQNKKQQNIEKVTIKEIKLDEKPIKNEKNIAKNNIISGYFIQVGAFAKKPNEKLFKLLKRYNLNYRLHKMDIKGRTYTKVLVGRFKTKAEALEKLPLVRDKINKKAYILRF